jgi:two-component system, response regulator YesN
MYRVIIADDEPKVSQLIRNLIEWDNLNLEHVATAHDGISALELIKKHRPDIVITDIRMPGYDGIELIKNTKEINPNIDFIIISGYQHFDYAHNAIKYGVKDYLLKPLNKNEINATLSKMIERYKEMDCEKSRQETHQLEDAKRRKSEFLESIYLNSKILHNRELDLSKINQMYNVKFIEGNYQGLIIKPDFEYHANNQEVMKMLLGKISKITYENLKDICSEILLLVLEDRIYTIINYKNENKKVVRKALNNIIDECHLFRDIVENLMVTIGLGSVQTSLERIERSTQEAKEALGDRIITGCGKISQYTPELHMEKSVESIISFERRKKLIDLIEIFDDKEIKKWIDEVEMNITKLSDLSGQFVLDTQNEIIEIILYGLKNHANIKTNSKSLIIELNETLQMQTNVQAVFKVTNKWVSETLRKITDDRKSESNRPIKEAQKYINEHYASAVSLEEVSAFVGFNATYFSTLFKKETGTNFLEYVTIARIKAAKQLLSDSKKSILDICCEVGYNDFKHFTKQFKKVTSLSPSEYRKLYY